MWKTPIRTSSPTVSPSGTSGDCGKIAIFSYFFRGRGMNTLTIKLILPSLIDNSLDNAFNKVDFPPLGQ